VESWLTVDGADGHTELTSLIDWLRHEVELRGRVRPVDTPPAAGAMGSLASVLTVAVGGGGTLTVLANSLTVWLRQPRRSTVHLSVVKPDGTKVEISGVDVRSPDEIEPLLRECLRPDTES
jgi:Effector Associated Constant Component 1